MPALCAYCRMLAQVSDLFSGEQHGHNGRGERDNDGYDESRFDNLAFNSQGVYGLSLIHI